MTRYGWITPVKMMIAAITSDPTIITIASSSVLFIGYSSRSVGRAYQHNATMAIGGCYVVAR